MWVLGLESTLSSCLSIIVQLKTRVIVPSGVIAVSVILSKNSFLHVSLRNALCLAISSHGGTQLLKTAKKLERNHQLPTNMAVPSSCEQLPTLLCLWYVQSLTHNHYLPFSSKVFIPYHPANFTRNIGLYGQLLLS